MLKEKMKKMGLNFTTNKSRNYNELSSYLVGTVMQLKEKKEKIIMVIDSESKETIEIRKEDFEKTNITQKKMEKMGFDLDVLDSEEYDGMAFKLMLIARGFKEVKEKVVMIADSETKEITFILKEDWKKLFKEEIF